LSSFNITNYLIYNMTMINKILRAFFFLFTPLVYAQTHIATYELTVIEKENYDEFLVMAQEDAYTNNFYLIFDKDYSLFTSDNISSDKVGMSDAIASLTNELIFDKQQKSYHIEKTIFNTGETYCIKRSELVEWQITDEKKIINNIECYRAVGTLRSYNKTGDNFIDAWFAPSIPYSYGPSYFNGLPGLILMVVDNNQYFFSLSEIHFDVEMNKDSKTIPEKICTENVITYQEYTKILSETNN